MFLSWYHHKKLLQMVMERVLLFLMVTLINLTCQTTAVPTITEGTTLIISTTETTTYQQTESSEYPDNISSRISPEIYEMIIITNVTNRFSRTTISSKIRNLDQEAKQTTFSVLVPETAYISGFFMDVEGQIYEAKIEEKEIAEDMYSNAIMSEKTAGIVSATARDSNRFFVNVNMKPKSKATFHLKYEELLQRINDQYEVILNVYPEQLVDKMNIEVYINETRPLMFVKTPPLRRGNEIRKNDNRSQPKSFINMTSKNSAAIKFSPDVKRQKELASDLGLKEEDGLGGQFVVQYDVGRDPYGGEILVEDGYFVHFFAPTDLPHLPKLVVFVLDTSGSMEGRRIKQVRNAMEIILYELNEDDVFHVVDFNSAVRVWNIENKEVQFIAGDNSLLSEPEVKLKYESNQTLPLAFNASEENKIKAKEIIDEIFTYGGTNMQSAFEVAIRLALEQEEDKKDQENDLNYQPLILFLTDGQATIGETSAYNIESIVTALNNGRASIFCLAFGNDADKKLLQRVSLKNHGFTRHIYEAADAYLQIEEFYQQISSPLLKNVQFHYVNNTVSKVTNTEFPVFFSGSEMIVTGEAGEQFKAGYITFNTKDEVVKLKTERIEIPVAGIERIWAYLTLKEVLATRETVRNKSRYTHHALSLAMEYSFVTPVTSLVLLESNNTEISIGTEDTSESERDENDLDIAEDVQAVNEEVQELNRRNTASIKYGFEVPIVDDFQTIKELKHNLPWLESIINDNVISLPAGTYPLTIDDIVKEYPDCSITSMNSTNGYCSPLYECTSVHPHLTDLKIYMKYFCTINGRQAGVCCPKYWETQESDFD